MLFFPPESLAWEKTISKFRMPSSMCFTIIFSPKLCSLPFFSKNEIKFHCRCQLSLMRSVYRVLKRCAWQSHTLDLWRKYWLDRRQMNRIVRPILPIRRQHRIIIITFQSSATSFHRIITSENQSKSSKWSANRSEPSISCESDGTFKFQSKWKFSPVQTILGYDWPSINLSVTNLMCKCLSFGEEKTNHNVMDLIGSQRVFF